jgi:hypothetical protein
MTAVIALITNEDLTDIDKERVQNLLIPLEASFCDSWKSQADFIARRILGT